ncbi:aspartyl-phosphate phosphatase Spo0E family protein [Neobacillus sp. D3-1R]|uniref:aspartyl-phosphate phosphatase Spo0E family protein n=1 Tax=Neobacillus sp. D3-1R TaxID=3445778 RepID=UPI003FA12BAB
MINLVIENLRNELYENTNISSLTSRETLQISQQLNQFLNYQGRTTMSTSEVDYSQSSVHSNAILNILEVAEKEKLDLNSLIETKINRSQKWYDINLVNLLLDTVEKNYGLDAVEYMGEFVPEKCIFPDSIKDFKSSLENLTQIYCLNHKSKVYIGEYLPYMLTTNELHMFCYTPHYHSAFNHGIIKGLSKRFNHSLKLSIMEKDHGGQFKIRL